MKRKNNILRTIAGLLILLLLLPVSTIGHPLSVEAALENEKNGNIIRSVNVSDGDIPNSSLIIGSYIIHINGLTDEVLEQAETSANEFNQPNRYYKSELAGGKWFDVTYASSITDISTAGVSVETQVVEALQFTHSVSANGEVTDLRYGLQVSPFDIKAPYCLWELEELEVLEIQYQILEEKKGKTDSDEVALSIMQNFYGKQIRTGNTDQYDNMITGLEKYKNELVSRKKPAIWVEEVQKVMVHVDALRRVEAYSNLSNNLEQLLNDISGQTEATNDVDDYVIDTGLVDAISQSIQSVEQSILEYSAQLLVAGDSAAMKARVQYSNELMNSVSASVNIAAYDSLPWYYKWYDIWIKVRATAGANYNQEACDAATQKLVNLSNASTGEVMDAKAELETLRALAAQAAQVYKEKLAAGVNEVYKTAVLQNTTQAVKEKHLLDQKAETDAARLEYQSILSATFERMGNEVAQKYIEELLNGIQDLRTCIPEDAVKIYQLETVEEHKNWLNKELIQVVMDGSDSTEMDRLNQELDELEKEKRRALDQNDLAKEKKIATEISAKKSQIDALKESLLNTIASSNSSEAQKARALAGLGQGNTASMLQKLASEIASSIRNAENSDSAKNKMEAFKAMSSLEPNAASTALAAIEEAVESAKENAGENGENDVSKQEMLEFYESAIGSTKRNLEQDGFGASEVLEIEFLLDTIESIIGGVIEEATIQEHAAMVWALARYGEDYKNNDARNLAISYATEMYSSCNPYFYQKFDDEMKEYVNLKSIGEILGYRYIFKDSHYNTSLSKGSEYYTFTNGSLEYFYTGNKSAELKEKAAYQKTVYLFADDAKSIFNVDSGYISGSDYAIVVTKQVEELANKIYDELTKK